MATSADTGAVRDVDAVERAVAVAAQTGDGAPLAIGDRRAAIEQTGGALTGAYPAGSLERLRDDWPA